MTKLILLFVCLISLAGCGDTGKADLEKFVNDVITTPRGRVEPIPEFKPYESFTYSAAALRSPFSLPIIEDNIANADSMFDVSPDNDRTKEYLEQFNIGELSMVGTLQKPDGELWALIRDGDGGVVRTKVGEYMGQNHGRIKLITDSRISLVEIVPNGSGGWLERPRTVVLEGMSGEKL